MFLTVNLFPNNIAERKPFLWHNPWANRTLDSDILPFFQWIIDLNNNRLIKKNGKKSWQLLGVYPNWPFEDE